MNRTISELTTMRVGGPATELVVAESVQSLVDSVRDADEKSIPVLVIGGGSNLIVGDDGFDGRVIRVATSGTEISGDFVTVAAGAPWDELVAETLDAGLGGFETLSGIPGSTGATPIQNVGAYGTDTSELLERVTVYDRRTGETASWTTEQCGFGSHRQSVFKHTDRYVVLDVTFRLARTDMSRPVKYAGLAERLGVDMGGVAPVRTVREAVLALRREKGMVLDSGDHDTWSVGSFFLNPVLRHVPAAAAAGPSFPDADGTKLSAAWLIQNSGFPRGYGADFGNGTVGLSSKHVLALTNRGGARAADVMSFAAHIRDGVEQAFGVRLTPECDLVGCSIP